MTDGEPRRLYVVASGTPAAEWLAQRLDDPQVQQEIRASFDEFARRCGLLLAEVTRAFEQTAAAYRSALLPAYDSLREQLTDAGVLDRPLPTDSRDRALELRRRRSTGPDRQVQHRRRPRRIA